jgi:hypothetical protein
MIGSQYFASVPLAATISATGSPFVSAARAIASPAARSRRARRAARVSGFLGLRRQRLVRGSSSATGSGSE